MKLLLQIVRFLIKFDDNTTLKFALVWYDVRYVTIKLFIRVFLYCYTSSVSSASFTVLVLALQEWFRLAYVG